MQQTNRHISMDWRAGSSKSGASANMTSILWRRLSSVASQKHPLIQPSKLSQQILQNFIILTAAFKTSLPMFIFVPIFPLMIVHYMYVVNPVQKYLKPCRSYKMLGKTFDLTDNLRHACAIYHRVCHMSCHGLFICYESADIKVKQPGSDLTDQ